VKDARKVKVLTVIYDLQLGGTQRAAVNYSLGYQDHGTEVKVLWIYQGGPYARVLEAHGIAICKGGRSLDASLEQLKTWSTDVIHVHRWGDSDPKIASVLRYLKTDGALVLETNVFSRFDDSTDVALTDIHFHLSQWCLWRWSTRPRKRSVLPLACVVPYIVASDSFYRLGMGERSSCRRKWRVARDAFVFGRIGQPVAGKWSKQLVPCFERVLSDNPNVYLLLVAPPAEIEAQIGSSDPHLKERTRVVPLTESDQDLLELYNCMDAFVHDSCIGESFGMVLAEAMLTGCPVITRSTPRVDNSQIEVVPHLEGGLVVADETSMVEAMPRLSREATFQERLGASAAAAVRVRFSPDVIMPRVLEIIDILQGTRDPEMRKRALIEKGVDVKVDRARLKSLLGASDGRYALKDWMFMKAPRLYQSTQNMKYRLAGHLNGFLGGSRE